MDDEALTFFKQLLEAPSPPGFEQPVQRVVRDWAGRYAQEVHTDVHGNVIAATNPQGRPRILLDGHCDQIGLIVQHIDELGFLFCQPMGGWDPAVLLGQNVTVWTRSGPVPGVIARKAKHLLTPEEQKKLPQVHELWVDLAVKTREQAAELVTIGDPVTLALGMRRLQGDAVVGVKMDNTTGLFVVFEALRLLHRRSFDAALFVVSAVQEEVGLRGAKTAAHGIDPQVGIAVDVTHATDYPNMDQRSHGDVRLGAGPVLFRGPNINPEVFAALERAARARDLPYQVTAARRGTPNDANPLQLTRAGVATGLVGIPNRYMHSPVEVVSLKDLDNAARILAHFVEETGPDADFTPR